MKSKTGMAYNEDSSASGHDEPWIQWFCGLKGHEMFCEVERAYIEDGFNLYGLRACVSNFSDCLDLILDRIGPDDSDDSHLTQSACTLYGLIHARYIITAHGLDAMYNKYASKEFGACPLVQCNGQPVLPVGLKDEVGIDTVKVFCPKCRCVYHPPPSRSRGGSGAVDGASFGTTFPHLFLMTFNQLIPEPLSAAQIYVPRVFGFRVHQSSRQMDNVLPLTNANVNSFNKLNAATKGATNVNTVVLGLNTTTFTNPPVSVVACSKAKNLSQFDRQVRQDLIRDMQQPPFEDSKPVKNTTNSEEIDNNIKQTDADVVKEPSDQDKLKPAPKRKDENGTTNGDNNVPTTVSTKAKRPKRLGNGVT